MRQAKTKNNKENFPLLEKVMTFKYLDNSYKMLWLKSILEEVRKGNSTISFDDLAIHMLGEAWELVLVKGLTYGRLDKVHRILEEIDDIWHVDPYLTTDEAIDFMKKIALKELQPLLSDLYEDTPYRFLEPLYESKLKGKKESVKNQMLEELINADTKAPYEVSSAKKTITVRKEWVQWLKANNKQVDCLLKDTMAYYLDKNAGKR